MKTDDSSRLQNLNKTIKAASQTNLYKDKNLKILSRLEDLSTLPFTTKQDLRENYPFGGLATDMQNVIEVHTSSGTTGKAVVSYLTKKDILEGNKAISKAWKTFGINKDSRLMFIMSYGLFSGAAINTYAIQHLGAFVLPAGIQPIMKQINLMIDYQIDTIVATPGFLLYLSDSLEKNNIPREKLNLKRAIAAGEIYSNQTRAKIEELLDIEVFDHYGLCEVNTGIAYECEYHNGLHILDDYVIAEIINPKTGGTLKLGELGELVLTSLKKEASPIIRYRTGDITKIIPGKCKCGRQSYRIDRIHGRINDTMFIRGIKVNPYELRDFILNIVGNNLKSSDIIFKIKKNDIKYTPQVYISVKDDKILPKLQKDIKDTTKVPFNINSVEPNFFGREDNNKVKLVQYVED